jgi:hypothetical protein
MENQRNTISAFSAHSAVNEKTKPIPGTPEIATARRASQWQTRPFASLGLWGGSQNKANPPQGLADKSVTRTAGQVYAKWWIPRQVRNDTGDE